MARSVANPIDVVLDIIRPTEDVKVAIDARSTPRSDADSETELWPGSDSTPRTKILAVVTHFQPKGKREQGCVFMFTRKPPRLQSIADDYVVEHAFPVMDGFSISMSQPRQTTLDFSLPPGSSFALNQPRTELTVTINPGEHTPFAPVTLQTHDTQGLRRFLDECKRLKEISRAAPDDDFDFEPFAWVAPYVADYAVSPLLLPIPPDLRKLKKAVHDRLSPASAGNPGNDVADIQVIREDWLRRKVREELFAQCEKASLKIRIGTFNVNGQFPSQDLTTWVRGHVEQSVSTFIPPLKEMSPLSIGELQGDAVYKELDPGNNGTKALDAAAAYSSSPSAPSDAALSASVLVDTASDLTTVSDPSLDVPEDPNDPDMLVLGFQELDLSTEALLYSTKTVREDAWCMAVFAGLGEKAVLYEKLASKQLVGMLLVIIIKKRLAANFSEIRTASVGAGIMGIMGNKGATAIRLVFTPTTALSDKAESQSQCRPTALTFVNSHLAAFDEMFDKRNADFHDISKRLVFDAVLPVEELTNTGSWYTPAVAPLNIYETDALFWLGDLNYRLTLSDADVRTLVADEVLRDENIKVLRSFDQLAFAMSDKKAFETFVEMPISHLPSYRFTAGVLSGMGYDMKRKPAWTDRILHMAAETVRVKQQLYTSHPTITMSDHRPVSAEYDLEVFAVSVSEYESFVQRAWRNVSGAEYAEERLRLEVTPTNVDFAKLHYKRHITKTLQVQNIGKMPCTFRFVGRGPAADVCPSWLRIGAITDLILPGQKTEVTLTAYLDDSTASRLNVGETRLQDTLVLHTSLGRDHFITVTGDFERTCFATSIAWLVRLPGPIRTLQSPHDVLPEDRGVNAPREIMRLINWLMTNATSFDGLFMKSGDEELVRQIRESLDTGDEFGISGTEGDPEVPIAFADTLLQMLRSLTEPVIPVALHAKCAQITSRDEAFELLDDLPMVNVNVLVSFTAFLHFIVQQEAYKRSSEQLVAIFTSVLFRDDMISPTPVSVVGKRNFLRYFIG